MKFAVLWCCAILIAGPSWAQAAEADAEGLDPMIAQLEKTLEENPRNPKAQYNLGTVLYHQGDYGRADGMLSQALAGAGNTLRQRAAYNLGNTQYRQGRTQEFRNSEEAVQYYRNALKNYRFSLQQDPEDPDAQFNYELTRKRLESLQQQQQSQSGQQGNNKEQQQQQDGQEGKNQTEGPEGQPRGEPKPQEEGSPDSKSSGQESASGGQGGGEAGGEHDESQGQGSQQGPQSGEGSGRSGKAESDGAGPSDAFSENGEWILDNFEREERKARALQQIQRDMNQGYVGKDW